MKDIASCNICHLAAEKDDSIKFTVGFQVFVGSCVVMPYSLFIIKNCNSNNFVD